jgi:hypothetical protein
MPMVLCNIFIFSAHSQTCYRGRPYIDTKRNTIVSDQGTLLRGGTFWIYGWIENKLNWPHYERAWELMVETRLNAVRLTCAYRPQYGDRNITLDGYEKILDSLIDKAEKRGIYCVIDYHDDPGNYRMDAAVPFWERFAPRYKDRKHVIYELTNEPVSWTPKQYTDANLRDFERLYQICRTAAPQTPIVILSFANVGRDGATGEEVAAKLNGIDWSKTVVGFHSYHRTDTRRFESLRAAFPVFNTEFENQETTGNMKVTTYDGVKYAYHASLMEKLEISWLQWDIMDTEWASKKRFPPVLDDLKEKGLYWEADKCNPVFTLMRIAEQTRNCIKSHAFPNSPVMFGLDGKMCTTTLPASGISRLSPGIYLIPSAPKSRDYHHFTIIK